MSKVLVQSYIKPELKEQAESVFESLGINTALAIQSFLEQSVNVGGLPWKESKQPNAETVEAMIELENGGGETFKTVDDLFASWGSDGFVTLTYN